MKTTKRWGLTVLNYEGEEVEVTPYEYSTVLDAMRAGLTWFRVFSGVRAVYVQAPAEYLHDEVVMQRRGEQ